jgi:putative DNA primase/helicase
MATRQQLEDEIDRLRKVMKWAIRSEAAPRINAMLDLARSVPGVPILPGQMDRDPWLLNCVNGTVDLRTGRLGPHRREDYLTRLCPTEYDPDAKCPVWEKLLTDVFPAVSDAAEEPGDGELIDFVQRYLGSTLTGDVRDQYLVIFYGAGANGKSTLVITLMDVLGPDYAMKANQELLVTKRGERHSTERMDLFGKRFVVASETDEGARLDAAFVKDLTGGEPVRGRRMREDNWQFDPTHKIVLLTNHKPRIYGDDHGIWRRVVLVPFDVTFWDPDDRAERARGLPERLRQDKQLPQKLRAEHKGILAWLVRGCLEWQRLGLRIPHRVSAATREYRDAEDVIRQFLEERCLRGPDYRVQATVLYTGYRQWCEDTGEKPFKQRTFGLAMTGRGFERDISNGVWYVGLTLRNS